MSERLVVLVVVLSAQFAIPLAISGSAVALPQIAAELGAEPVPLQLVVNGFNIAFAVCTVVWGVISDRIGHVRAFRIGVVVALAGAVASALAPNNLMLDAGRIIAGIGSAAVLTGAAPILNRFFEGEERSRAFVLFGTINGLGLAAGPALSGLVLAGWGWRGMFVAHAVVLAASLLGSSRLPSLSADMRSLRDLLDFTVLKNPRFSAMALIPVAGAAGCVTFLTYLPSALSAIYDVAAGPAGELMLIMTVPVLLAPAFVQRIVRGPRVTLNVVAVSSFACLFLGAIGVALLTAREAPIWVGVAPMLLIGLEFGLPLGFVDAEALSVVPAQRAGAASGVLNLFRIGSEALFVAAYAAILSAVVVAALPGDEGLRVASGAPGSPLVYGNGLAAAAFTMAGVVVVLGIVFVVLVRRAAPLVEGAPSADARV